jgi:hypothetical protein
MFVCISNKIIFTQNLQMEKWVILYLRLPLIVRVIMVYVLILWHISFTVIPVKSKLNQASWLLAYILKIHNLYLDWDTDCSD